MNYLYLLAKFIIGGGIIVGVTLLAQHVDPKYGGILAAAPITTTLAFLFTYSEQGRQPPNSWCSLHVPLLSQRFFSCWHSIS